MATSYVIYAGLTGSVTDFSIPFEYLDQSFVKATVGGTSVPLTFLSTYMVRFTPGPVGTLKIYRETAREPINEYTNGSILDATDLNVSFLQTVHMTEEVVDSTIVNDSDGSWDATNLRIKNVADPVEPQDAATKNWAETTGASFVSQSGANATAAAAQAAISTAKATEATTQANRAETEADRSQGEADRSTLEADRAEAQANRSQDEADRSDLRANNAESAASMAGTAANTATTKASEATTSAATATTKAGEANTSAQNAYSAGQDALYWRNETEGFRNSAAASAQTASDLAEQLDVENLLNKNQNLAELTNPAAARGNLGLASALPVTNNTDPLDFNTLTTPGWSNTLVLGTNPNGWGVGEYCYLLVTEYNGTELTQIAFPYSISSKTIRWRGRYQGTWTPWSEARTGKETVSTSAPSGGANGDVWYQV